MADAHDHNHEHPQEGAEAQKAPDNRVEQATDEVGTARAGFKANAKGVLGGIWDALKDGAKKGWKAGRKGPEWLGFVGSKNRATQTNPSKTGNGHDHSHDHEATTNAEPATESAPVTPAQNSTDQPSDPNAPANQPANHDKKDEKAGNNHDKKHDAHAHGEQKGMSNLAKGALITTGIAGATVVGSTALVATAAVEVAGSIIEHGPKWLQTAGNLVKWPFRATGKFLGNTLGEPLANAKEGFEYGREELVGHADYDELTGWTAPLKLVSNGWKSLWQNPVTRFAGGLVGGALGFAGGLVKGPIQGAVDAFSEENAPTWEMPIGSTRKPKKNKEKKAPAREDSHGHGGDHGHAEPAHGHAEPAHHRKAA